MSARNRYKRERRKARELGHGLPLPRMGTRLACTLATTDMVRDRFPNQSLYAAILERGGGGADPAWEATGASNISFGGGQQWWRPPASIATAEDWL